MTFEYTEAELQTGSDRSLKDILISELADIGFESFVDIPNGFQGYIRTEEFDLEAFKKCLADNNYSSDYKIKNIPSQNWNALWESQFEPIEIGKDVYIRAPFHDSAASFKYELIVEPKMSFGTGHHSTTRLMCQAMLESEVKGLKICDMGCGTGILGILAMKMGASEVTAIDIEFWAYENSIENASRNGVEMEVIEGGAEKLEGKRFDAMLANINRNILINDFDKYAQSLTADGWILLSGFLETDVDAIIKKGREQGFEHVKTYLEDHWRCIKMMKKSVNF